MMAPAHASRQTGIKRAVRHDLDDPRDCGIPARILSTRQFQSIYGPWPSDTDVHHPMVLSDIHDLSRDDLTDDQRMRAAARLVDSIFTNPIHPVVWQKYRHRFIAELLDRAKSSHFPSWQAAFRHEKITALFSVVRVVLNEPPFRLYVLLYRALHRELANELLGPGWWRESSSSFDDENNTKPIPSISADDENDAESPPGARGMSTAMAAQLQVINMLASLDSAAEELWRLKADECPEDEIAAALNCSTPAMRKRWERLRKRLAR